MLPNLDKVARTVWHREGFLGRTAAVALQPAALVFRGLVGLRDLGYRSGLLSSESAGIPVISVGNLTVGGTGKTPITLWLARRLTEYGRRVAIVSRGYAGSAREVVVVSQGDGPIADVSLTGDEPAMLAKSFSGTVIVARHRSAGAAAARELGCDVVLLDDGFQHRALARDFDLVLVGGDIGGLLPAGAMREGWRALRRADAVAIVEKPGRREPASITLPAGVPTFRVRFRATALVESIGGAWHERPLTELAGKRVVAISGIAEPEPFYAQVREWEAEIVDACAFPDHHRYTADDWHQINRATRDAELVVTTEKDLVKLERFPFAKGSLVAIRIEPRIDDEERLLQIILDRIPSTRGS